MPSARVAAVGLVLAALVAGGGAARADGAFPDSLSVLVPADRPHFIGLATNFGLISTNDDGASWTWVCEGPITNCSTLYSVSAPPADRLFAISADSLVYSDDDACDWSVAGGAVSGGGVVDAFPLAQDGQRVLAVVSPNGVGPATTYTVVSSQDGGKTFGGALYQAASGDVVTGVEAARTDANIIFVTIASSQGFAPVLAVTTDGGAHWRTRNLSPELQQSGLRLIAIDRTNPMRVFLRVAEVDAEVLAVYDASADTITQALSFPGGLMTAFVQTAAGPLLAAGRINDSGVLHRSIDDGATWQPVTTALHLRALAERDGTVYGATDDMADSAALTESTDLGLTWKAVMRYASVGSIAACVRAACLPTCMMQAGLGIWPASTCSGETKAKSSGGCAVAGADAALGLALVPLALVAIIASRPYRGRRRSSRAGQGR